MYRMSLSRDVDRRFFFAAGAAGLFGAGVGRVALPLLAVSVLDASAFEVGLLTAAQTAAFVVIGLPAGAVVDRVRRLPTMIAMELVRFGLTVGVVVLWGAGLLDMVVLIAIVTLVGCATVFFDVASMACLPDIVERDQLRAANGRLQGISSACSVGGPAAAGGLAAIVGAGLTVAGTAAGYVVSAALLCGIRHRETRPAPRPWHGIWGEAWEGLRHVFGDRELRAIALCTASVNLALAVRLAVLVIFLVELDFSPGEVGVAMAAAGVGGVLAAFAPAGATMHRGWTVLLVTQPFAALVPLAGGPYALVLVCVGMAIPGYGAARYNIAQITFRQLACPPELLGRVGASNRFLVWSTLPVGGLLGGVLGTYLSLETVLWLVTAGMVTSVLWLARWRRGAA
jgi:MFS family permease